MRSLFVTALLFLSAQAVFYTTPCYPIADSPTLFMSFGVQPYTTPQGNSTHLSTYALFIMDSEQPPVSPYPTGDANVCGKMVLFIANSFLADNSTALPDGHTTMTPSAEGMILQNFNTTRGTVALAALCPDFVLRITNDVEGTYISGVCPYLGFYSQDCSGATQLYVTTGTPSTTLTRLAVGDCSSIPSLPLTFPLSLHLTKNTTVSFPLDGIIPTTPPTTVPPPSTTAPTVAISTPAPTTGSDSGFDANKLAQIIGGSVGAAVAVGGAVWAVVKKVKTPSSLFRSDVEKGTAAPTATPTA